MISTGRQTSSPANAGFADSGAQGHIRKIESAYAESKPERPKLAKTRAGKLLRYFDSTPRTTSRQAQTAAPQNLQLDRPAEIFLLSRDRHTVKQIISECPSALPELFEIVPEPMRHDCYSDGLDVFGKKHLTSVHQRPSL